MRTSLQAGPSSVSSALSRIWACLTLRTSALPRASSRSSSSRSAGVSVTRYFLVMAGLLAAASPLTKKRQTPRFSPDKALGQHARSHRHNAAPLWAQVHAWGVRSKLGPERGVGMKGWLLFSLSALTGATLATLVPEDVLPSAVAASSGTFQQLGLFSYVFDRLRTNYVEPPNEAKLIEGALKGMLTSLDPHSGYMTPKELREMQTETRGAFGGLGLEVTMEDGLVKVVAPIDDTPAARAGILANDIITQISGEPVQGLTLNQAVDKMRGPVNSSVKLTIQRKEKKELLEVKLTRQTIRIHPVRAHTEGGDIGYLRLTQFSEQTYDALRTAIKSIAGKVSPDKLKGYV